VSWPLHHTLPLDLSVDPLGEIAPAGDLVTATATAGAAINNYIHIFVIAFMVTLLATPIVRRFAVARGIIDRPDSSRKAHPYPVAYLGGVAVFAGLLVAIAASYVYAPTEVAVFGPVPIAIVIGMVAIAFTGLADDIWGWHPRLKIAGQLVAAAALAIEEVGVRVAAGALTPIFGAENLVLLIPTPLGEIPVDIVYWLGTALIAAFVLGGCNAANLIDGLDGLLSGVAGIVAIGLLLIALLMLTAGSAADTATSESLAGARVVLCLALLGAVLGFLPHNFNPAAIFLGDCGSLLIGYTCVVIILMLGENGQTHLVFAGLIVFALPIMDTTLAILRRWLAGIPMSVGDDQHIHHQLKRSFGGVKSAVFAMYGISALFAAVGVALAALVLRSEMRLRFVYVIAVVLFSFIAVIAVKAARRQQLAAAPIRQIAKAIGPGAVPAGSATIDLRREPATAPSPAPLPAATDTPAADNS
jgi:UDP-GlcNAc:undecaprenyl-phosphate/decaprenyl-phosphate GlcNAc-1-phosphate transferase